MATTASPPGFRRRSPPVQGRGAVPKRPTPSGRAGPAGAAEVRVGRAVAGRDEALILRIAGAQSRRAYRAGDRLRRTRCANRCIVRSTETADSPQACRECGHDVDSVMVICLTHQGIGNIWS